MKELLIKAVMVACFIALVCAIGYGSWRIKRWANWKFSYGPIVEQRIEKIEKRVQEIEKRLDARKE